MESRVETTDERVHIVMIRHSVRKVHRKVLHAEDEDFPPGERGLWESFPDFLGNIFGGRVFGIDGFD